MYSSSFSSNSNIPYSSSPSSMSYSMSSNKMPYSYNNQDRIIGGGAFLGPFILGGITGGLLAPAFYPRPYPIYSYPPYPYYGPYYR